MAARRPGQRHWVIDPIDGTKNFVRGVPIWATLIALMEGDQPVVGLVSAPALGRRWWAALGPRRVRRAGTPRPRPAIRVSGVSRLADASFCYSSPDRLGGDRPARRRCSTSSGRPGAAGRTATSTATCWSPRAPSTSMVEPELSLWDLAALIPIVTEAGGTFTDLAGRPGPGGGSAVATNGQAARRDPRPAGRLMHPVRERDRGESGDARPRPVYPRRVMSSGWFFLAAMIAPVRRGQPAAVGRRGADHRAPHASTRSCCCGWPGTARTWSGCGCQILGFVLAFLARRDLPLFLVQASVAAGLGVTALLGVLVLKWRLPPRRVALLALLCVGHRRAGPLGAAGTRPASSARPAWSAWSWRSAVIARARLLRGPAARRARLGGARLAGRARVRRGRRRRPAAGRRALARASSSPTRCSTCWSPTRSSASCCSAWPCSAARRPRRSPRWTPPARCRPRSSACCFLGDQIRAGPRVAGRRRLRRHAGRGDRPDPVRRTAAPPPAHRQAPAPRTVPGRPPRLRGGPAVEQGIVAARTRRIPLRYSMIED